MTDRKTNPTAAAKTIATHTDNDELPPEIKEFLLANRAKVMKFFNAMMDPEQNAVWRCAFEEYPDLTDEFKARARAMFEDAVDAKVETEVEEVIDAIEADVARLIEEREQLLDYIERECPPLDESLESHQSSNTLNEMHMARYVDAIKRTSLLT